MFENDINLLYSKENYPPASSVRAAGDDDTELCVRPQSDSKLLYLGNKPALAAGVCVCTEILLFLFSLRSFSQPGQSLLNLVYCVQVCVTDVEPGAPQRDRSPPEPT